MTIETLRKKTGRYLLGQSVPAEKNQIQYWLSCTADRKVTVSGDERTIIEDKIIGEIKAYIEYTRLDPEPDPWWKKITAFF